MKSDFTLAKEELQRIGIKRVAADFYAEPKRKGSVYFVKSPATHDKTASLALYPNSNRFTDFANGNLSGDCISFVVYVKGCNQWQALKELQVYYGLMDAREVDRQEAQRRIELQQQEERRKEERRQAFYAALWGEIDRLKRWEYIYRLAIEKAVFEPFSDTWAYCVNELPKTGYRLDILCAADCREYMRLKPYHENLPSDRYKWLLDVLAVLAECGAFTATTEELKEIKAQAAFEVQRKPGQQLGGVKLNGNKNVLRLLAYKVDYDRNGNEKSRKVLQTVRNCEIIIENDERFAGKIKFDEFSQQTYLVGDIVWQSDNNRAWSSYDDSALFSILQSDYDMKNRNDYFDALKNVSMRNKFHPVREMLDSFKWDGKENIRSLLPCYLGVVDSEYSYQVMRLQMIGAVARVYEPGCKFDYTMIFTGPQGIGKSTFLRKLALKDEWFNDSLDSLDSNKAAQSIMGSWIIELAELKSLARTAGGVDFVKRFLTATQDKLRLPYERRTDVFLRQCVFAGTTNKSDFLQDETGNRRFLIIQTGVNEPTKSLFTLEATEDIKAAWAQAVHILKTEKPQLILPDSCREEAQRLQEDSMADDGKVGIITEYLADKQRTCAIEIWQKALGEQGRPQKWQAGEINNIILSLPGWEKMKNPGRFGECGQQRGFQKLSTKPSSNCLQTVTNSDGFMQIDPENEMELPFD